jgi:hypothetical protein
MLRGAGVVALWNDVVREGIASFHAWHIHEHMAERVAIPGFRRGRRYVAADAATAPAFFTLYEVETLAVLTGAAYTARLNAPTPATAANIPNFRNTVRALAGVAASDGEGVGGAVLTLGVEGGAGARDALAALLARPFARRIGAHLCRTDMAASGIVTREKEGRTTLARPPAWFAIIEATDIDALAAAPDDAALAAAGAEGPVARGLYRLEQLRDAPA